MKKGNWVQFNLKGNIKQGLIVKGGKRITVYYDHKATTCKQVTGHPSLFTLIEPVELDESGYMTPYSLKAYKDAGGEETIRFEAKLCKDGKVIAIVSNGGYGGCNDYHATKGNQDALAQYFIDVDKWAKFYGDKEPFEPEDKWIAWYMDFRVTGVSVRTMFEDIYQTHP